MGLQKKIATGAKASTAVLLAALLSGCSSLGSDTPGASVSDTAANLLAFNSPAAPPMSALPKQEVRIDCPMIEVQAGTAAMRTYTGGDSNGNVRYQYSLGETARQCDVSGRQISIKVGVEGRVLIGPMGTPGSFSAPIRVAIRDENGHKPIISKMYRIPVTVPAGAAEAPFSFVTEALVVPLVNARADQDYTILVGFDSAGSVEATTTKRHKRRS